MSAAAEHRLESTRSLRREWAAFALFCLAFLALGAFLLSAQWPPEAVLRWSLLSGAVMLYMLLVLQRNLGVNHRPGDSALLPGLGWGNRLTLLRGMLLAALVGFAGGPAPTGWLAWAPGVIYSLAVAADALDGFVARRTRHVTRLGEILDMSLDGLGVLGAALLIVVYGRAPVWFILVGLARYLFLAGVWLRQHFSRPVHPLPPSTRRRMYASIQMVFLAAMLFPLFSPPLTAVAAAVFALFFLASFTWDWLLVSGALRRAPVAWTNWSQAGLPILQVALRIGLLILAVIFTLQSLESSSPAVIALSLPQLLAAGLVFLGTASRISSGVALILIGLGQTLASPGPLQVIQVIAYSIIIFIGSGPYSLWLLEESWFKRPAHQPGQAEMNRSQRETLPPTASEA